MRLPNLIFEICCLGDAIGMTVAIFMRTDSLMSRRMNF